MDEHKLYEQVATRINERIEADEPPPIGELCIELRVKAYLGQLWRQPKAQRLIQTPAHEESQGLRYSKAGWTAFKSVEDQF